MDVVLASVTWLRCACRASPSFTPPWKAVTMQGPHLRGGRSALVPWAWSVYKLCVMFLPERCVSCPLYFLSYVFILAWTRGYLHKLWFKATWFILLLWPLGALSAAPISLWHTLITAGVMSLAAYSVFSSYVFIHLSTGLYNKATVISGRQPGRGPCVRAAPGKSQLVYCRWNYISCWAFSSSMG